MLMFANTRTVLLFATLLSIASQVRAASIPQSTSIVAASKPPEIEKAPKTAAEAAAAVTATAQLITTKAAASVNTVIGDASVPTPETVAPVIASAGNPATTTASTLEEASPAIQPVIQAVTRQQPPASTAAPLPAAPVASTVPVVHLTIAPQAEPTQPVAAEPAASSPVVAAATLPVADAPQSQARPQASTAPVVLPLSTVPQPKVTAPPTLPKINQAATVVAPAATAKVGVASAANTVTAPTPIQTATVTRAVPAVNSEAATPSLAAAVATASVAADAASTTTTSVSKMAAIVLSVIGAGILFAVIGIYLFRKIGLRKSPAFTKRLARATSFGYFQDLPSVTSSPAGSLGRQASTLSGNSREHLLRGDAGVLSGGFPFSHPEPAMSSLSFGREGSGGHAVLPAQRLVGAGYQSNDSLPYPSP
ncbi:hypothetical protein HKX48_004741 [Thoreauomyces humboldtii]|nr:hypothetical protein HKX48_004741 [Thoreauomyces humboldtii]